MCIADVNEQMSHTVAVFRNQRSVLLVAMVHTRTTKLSYISVTSVIPSFHLASSLIFIKLVLVLTGFAVLLAFYSFDQFLCLKSRSEAVDLLVGLWCS